MLQVRRAAVLEGLLLDFAKYLERHKPQLAFASISAYQSDARLFIAFLRRCGVSVPPPPTELETAYIDSLRLKRETVRRKATGLRYFREFLVTVPMPPPVGKASVARASKAIARISPKPLRSANRGNLNDLVRLFVESRSSVATSRAYWSDLRKFVGIFDDDVSAVEAASSVQAFIDAVNESAKFKPRSVCRMIASLRSFFGWAHEERFMRKRDMPVLCIPPGCADSGEPQPKVAVEQFDEALQRLSSQSSLRDAAIVWLLREGLTPAEVVALSVESFDPQGNRMVVIGRKQRERYVSLTSEACTAVTDLIAHTRTPEERNVPLITNVRGGRLSTRSVGRIVRKFADAAELPSHTHPLTVRYAGAQPYAKDPHTLKHRLGITGAQNASRYMG